MMISPVTQELQRAPVDHIVPLQIASSILLYGFCQRMYEIVKPDGQKCCMWMMAIFSESGPLWCTAFPNTYINQRSFPRSHLEMNTAQPFLRSSILPLHEVSLPMNTKGKTHSTHSGCLSSNYHGRLSPEERILHRRSNMMWFSSCFSFHECVQMFIFMRFGAAGYSRSLNAASRTGAQTAARDEQRPVAKAQEDGKVAGWESMQEIAATIAPSCTVNLSNIKAAESKSPIWAP